jgi:8-oxo-dGTP pyrophosphatase MutT (NUDIX family)
MKNQDTLQVIVFRKEKGKFQFLLLKRIADKGGFWQPITARIEEKENPLEGAKRELKEEVNISQIKKEIKVWDFPNGQGNGKEFIFAFEVEPNTKICLDCNIYPEHENYKWCNFEEAFKLAKFPQKKEAIKRLKDILDK